MYVVYDDSIIIICTMEYINLKEVLKCLKTIWLRSLVEFRERAAGKWYLHMQMSGF